MGLFDFMKRNKERDSYLEVWDLYGFLFSSESKTTVLERASRLSKDELYALKLSVLLVVQRNSGEVALRKLWTLHSKLRSGEVMAIAKESRYAQELSPIEATAAELLRMAVTEAYVALALAAGEAVAVSPLSSPDTLARRCAELERALALAGKPKPID